MPSSTFPWQTRIENLTTLEPEIEIAVRYGVPLEPRENRRILSVQRWLTSVFTDLLEAMYTRGRGGWAESDLLALIAHVNGTGDVPPTVGFTSRSA